MPTLSLEFEVYCSCGHGLCNQSTEGTNRHAQYITVEPCPKCLERNYDAGYDKGYESAKEQFEEV
jgi:hypothetical protein